MRSAVGGLLDGRRAIVTGGANGIGAVIAARFAGMGATGVILDLPSALTDVVPVGWSAAAVDVTDEGAVRQAIAEASNVLSGIDAVVAAAGIVPSWHGVEDLDLDEFDRVFAVNSRGVAATIKHVASALGEGATITVIASAYAARGEPNILAYAASKHAALGVVRSAALALGPAGVRVNAVGPGPIATAALRGRIASREAVTGLDVEATLAELAKATALRRIATAEQVADTVAFLTSDLSAGITGQMIGVDGGLI